MRYGVLGRSGIVVSLVAAGGWQAGREDWAGIDDAESVAAYRAAFDGGVTTFDTAEEYGDGHSERLLREALGSRRDETVIASKVSWRHLSARGVALACDRSLANLGTDRIDLYLVHWPAGSFGSDPVPLDETIGALTGLQQAGKVRSIGVSNFSRAQLEHATQLARIDAVQVPYSLFWRQAERELLPFARSRSITVMAYSPLAQGLLAGRFGPDEALVPGDNRADNKLFRDRRRALAHAASTRLGGLAEAYGLTTAQLALSWLVARPGLMAVVGSRTAGQAVENAAAGSVTVPAAVLAEAEQMCCGVWDGVDEGPMWDWQV
jgi:aryl-alcohol dehydrogenase-like predicted oxidoreductase